MNKLVQIHLELVYLGNFLSTKRWGHQSISLYSTNAAGFIEAFEDNESCIPDEII